MGILEQAQEALSCKQIIYTLGSVVTAETLAIVAMAKFGWTHALDDIKVAREREAVVNLAMTTALKKKGESPA